MRSAALAVTIIGKKVVRVSERGGLLKVLSQVNKNSQGPTNVSYIRE